MARMWWARTSGYRLGVLFLFLASVFYVLGYSVPFWHVITSGRAYQGLWLRCAVVFSQTECRPIRGIYTDDWFKAVQVMESVGLAGVVISCMYALVVNCCEVTASHNRLLEVMTALSGLCGFIGCMVFVGEMPPLARKHLSWAFGINLTGSILLMIVAVILYISNREQLAFPTTAGVIVWSGPAPSIQGGPATVIVQNPGQGYPSPHAGMVYAVAQPGYGYNYQGHHPGAATAQFGYTAPATQVIPAAVPTQPVPTGATTQPVSTAAATQPVSTAAATQPVSKGATTGQLISTKAKIQAIPAAAATQPVHASGPTQAVQAEATTETVMLQL